MEHNLPYILPYHDFEHSFIREAELYLIFVA